MGRRFVIAFLLGTIGSGLPAVVLAHPLGNFTINHYAGITVGRDRVQLDVVIDMAEIPAFQERLKIDANGDGDVSDGEALAAAPIECATEAGALRLTVGGAPIVVDTASRAVITFPAGLGGLSTMRIECGYSAPLTTPLSGPTTITFSDTSYTDRIGWREVVPSGDGVAIGADGLPTTSPSKRLTSYPVDLIRSSQHPRRTRSARPFPPTLRRLRPLPRRGSAPSGRSRVVWAASCRPSSRRST
jgi:hypothetical protein